MIPEPKIDLEKGKALLYRTKELVEAKDWDTFEKEIIPLIQGYWKEASVPEAMCNQMYEAMKNRLGLLRTGQINITEDQINQTPPNNNK